MTANLPSETVSDVENNRLTIGLAEAYATAGRSLPDEEEMREEDKLQEVPQGLTREILDVMEQTLDRVDMVNVREIRLDLLMQNPVIQRVEGSNPEKEVAMRIVIDCIADAVAESIWKLQNGTEVDTALTEAQIAGEEELERVDAAWTALVNRVRSDFGL